MGSLGWKWRQLRAMSAQEVAMRVARAVRERVLPLDIQNYRVRLGAIYKEALG